MEIPDQLTQFKLNQEAARQMLEMLGNDCKEHLRALRENDSQIHRRAYIRAVFAFIEGLVYCQKMSTASLGLLLGAVTIHELIALEDINLEINDSGEVTTRTTYPKFLHNIQFAFKVYSKSIDSEFKLNKGGIGWQSLQKAVKVRDRLMHPKEVATLTITNEEVSDAQHAFNWFFLSYSLCSLYAQKAMCLKSNDEKDLEKIAASIKQLEAQLK